MLAGPRKCGAQARAYPGHPRPDGRLRQRAVLFSHGFCLARRRQRVPHGCPCVPGFGRGSGVGVS
eukprot:11181543-Lingulodinium_polyedra.AAC.1